MRAFSTFRAIATGILTLSLSLTAADWYVSVNVGNNKNDGSQAKPFKNIWKAVDKAANGDVIHVAGASTLAA
jgi:hypothetical protein